MANLPEKNITTVDKITSIPSNTNLYINANGEFRQATVDDVLKASPVITDSIVNQYKNASGSPILLTDSAKGVVIDFNAKGRSTQTQYSGKNELNLSGLSASIKNGITFTPYYDDNGSLLYLNVNGTATEDTQLSVTNRSIPKGAYTLNGLPSGASANTYRQWLHNLTTSDNYMDTGSGASFILNEDSTTLTYALQIRSGVTVNNLKFYPMVRLASVTDSTYEPYVGGTASPNPEYPQAIKSVGDMGYFDGELLQGLYNSGVFVSDSRYVCSKNPILCNDGDIVKFAYGTIADTICFRFYDKDMNYMSYQYSKASSECEITVPTGAKYTNFYLLESNTSITPQTAKRICVTINDKYALIVDSKGTHKVDITTVKGMAKITATADGNTIVVGAYPEVYGVYFDNSDVGLRVGETYTFSVENVDNYNASGGHGFRLGYADGTFGSMNGLEMTATIEKEVSTINFYLGAPYTGNLESRIEGLMIRPVGTDDTYEPYKKSRKYIPISAPLRGIGEVTDVASLSECKVDRKFVKAVFDGSADENWSLKTIGCELYLNNTNSGNALCTHYKKNNGVSWGDLQGNEFNIIGTVLRIKDNTHQSTLDEWKAHLQSNPITVIYELAEPTTETIEYVDIDTFEGVTHIRVSDDADMEVEYPTSKVAGIASIGWSKGRRAEYDLEQLKAQILALQTTIVSTV